MNIKLLAYRNLCVAALAVTGALLSGCTGNISTLATRPATLSQATQSHGELVSLPMPAKKIPVAVYSFRDQTGQYKPSTGSATNFSTAVTQGATAMLIQALNDSNWFIPIEREGLQNLTTERKIIRNVLDTSTPEKERVPMPPLLYANIILEGGITAYESNILTGGLGAKYFGIGGNVDYRMDRVTIFLRAVDVRSGRILKTVSTSKSIYSRGVDIGVFRYVSFKRLLEMESGFTTNEPAQLCVMDAIEKAVTALVVEGIFDKLWTLRNSDDINAQAIRNYLREKNEREFQIPPREYVADDAKG